MVSARFLRTSHRPFVPLPTLIVVGWRLDRSLRVLGCAAQRTWRDHFLGLGVTAWSPLAGGLLTGKQLEPGGLKDSRQSNPSMQQFMKSHARKEAVAREVVAVAREGGHSPAQVALAWLRQRPDPVIPIIGARKLAQVKDNLACVGGKLTPAHIERLDAVSRIEMGFPHDLFATDMVRSLNRGGMWDQIDA